MQPRLLCALALAALLPLARAQSCPDDPDHVLASYGLNCDVISNAYACDVDLKRLGWAKTSSSWMPHLYWAVRRLTRSLARFAGCIPTARIFTA